MRGYKVVALAAALFLCMGVGAANPSIQSVALNITSQDLFLQVDVTSDDRIDTVAFNGVSEQVNTTDSQIDFNISDSTVQSGNVTVTDSQGAEDGYEIGFDATVDPYLQAEPPSNLSLQILERNDTVTNTHGSNDLDVIFNPKTYGGDIREGGTAAPVASPGEEVFQYTKIAGDFLNETISEWKQDRIRPDPHTVDTVYIRKELKVESKVPGTSWNAGKLGPSPPTGFGSCEACGQANLDFTDEYTNLREWYDQGDPITEADQVIEETDDVYLEKRGYTYTSTVDLTRIQASNPIENETKIRVRPHALVKAPGYDERKEASIEERVSCQTIDPDYVNTTIEGKTWQFCAADTNFNDYPDEAKYVIPEFTASNDEWTVWTGGYINEKNKTVSRLKVGQTGCDTDLDGKKDEEIVEDAVCFRNKVVKASEPQEVTVDETGTEGAGTMFIIGLSALLIVVALIFTSIRGDKK